MNNKSALLGRMIEIKFLLLVLLIGITGWSSWWLFFSDGEEELSLLRNYFFIFLSGFAITSVCLFLFTFIGCFQWKIQLVFFAGLLALYLWKAALHSLKSRLKLAPYLLLCLLLGLISLALTKISKPFDAILWGDDASVFIGAASQLARTGSLTYVDPLVLEMTREERAQLLNNRIRNDMTGDLLRFPGGVRLLDAKSGKVGFSFYHLLPAWLALGIQTLGNPGYLNLLALFSTLSLVSIYFLGERFAGPLLGISLLALLFLFYPQNYFSRMPSAEILSQLLFLAGLLILVTELKNSQIPAPKQTLVGMIWGALFLCRVESMFMLSTSLILTFSLVPIFSRNHRQWHHLILPLFLFSCWELTIRFFAGSIFIF